MAQLEGCHIFFWVLIGAGEYNCLWFFGSVFTTVLRFRFSSSFLSSNVSFLRYCFASALDTLVRHRDSLYCHVDINGILRIFAWAIYICVYKVLLVYSFEFHLLCYYCLLILTVLCFSVCCLFTCPLCCCFICGGSAIGMKYTALSFSFYNNSFPSNAFYLLFFLFAKYASFKLCLCHSIKVTKYTS